MTKNSLKLVIGVLLILSLGIWILPLFRTDNTNISLLDILLTGASSYGWVIAVTAIFIIIEIEAFLVLSDGAIEYLLSAFIALADTFAISGITFFFYQGINSYAETVRQSVSIAIYSVLLWGAVHLAILVLSIIGIVLYRILPSHEEIEQPQDGMIIGVTGACSGLSFKFADDQWAYFSLQNNQVIICDSNMRGVIGSACFIEEEEQYCVRPARSMTFFLESGQPLGKNREYKFPHGTMFYINDELNRFQLP